MRSNGFYLSGKTPQKAPVEIFWDARGLEYGPSGAPVARIHKEKLDIELINSHECYVHLNRSLGERLEIHDPEFVAAFRRGDLLSLEGAKFKKAVVLIGAIFLVMAALYLALPAAFRMVAQRIPVEYEMKLRDFVLKQMKSSQDAAARAAAEKVLVRLQAKEPDPYPIHLILDPQPITNAFALPGGVIVFHRGLIEMMNTPEEFAGVLAHEIQHQKLRHITTAVVRGTLMSAIWGAALGDFGSFMVVDPSTLVQITNLQFARRDEEEADREGAEMLRRAEISVVPMLDFLDRLSGKVGEVLPEFLSSHPLKNRGSRLREEFGDHPTRGEVLTPKEWQFIKTLR